MKLQVFMLTLIGPAWACSLANLAGVLSAVWAVQVCLSLGYG